MEKERKIKRGDIVKLCVLAALFIAIVVNYKRLTELDVRKLIESASSVYAAAATVLGIYCVKAVSLVIPASLVYISVGMAFSTPVAVLLNCVGIALEVTITYFMGKFLGAEKVESMLRKKKGYEKIEKYKSKGRYAFVFLLRFASFPIDFGSLFFGASSFPFPSYFLMSLAGILPRVIVMTILGTEIYELIPMKYIITAVVCLIPVGAVAFVIYKLVGKKKKNAEGEKAEEDAAVSEEAPGTPGSEC